MRLNPSENTMDQIDAAQQQWAQAIESRDIERVLALYDAERGVLWGTVANHLRQGHAALRTYFERFLAHEGIKVAFESSLTREFGPIAISSGAYRFQWHDPGQQPVDLLARFTYTYRRDADRWLIVDHHSSAMPENGI